MYFGALNATVKSYRAVGRVEQSICDVIGGIKSNCVDERPSGIHPHKYMCDCVVPEYSDSGTSVNVSPVITTTVSPQISPVLQQQFQPTGSPATAGTSQVTPVGMTPVSNGITGQSQLPPAPAPVPVAAPAPTSQVVYLPAPASEQLPAVSAPVAPAQVSVPVPVTTPVFDWKIAAIIGAGLIGVMATQKRK